MTVSQLNQRRCGNTHRRLRLELSWAGLSLAVLPPGNGTTPTPRLFCSRCSRVVGSFNRGTRTAQTRPALPAALSDKREPELMLTQGKEPPRMQTRWTVSTSHSAENVRVRAALSNGRQLTQVFSGGDEIAKKEPRP